MSTFARWVFKHSQRAEERWSLGLLTLSYPLVRIVVAEQLYRAASLLANPPSHRG